MKVAVCVSGAMTSQLPGRNLNRNLELLRANFPDADFYFSSWTGYADKNINEDVIYKGAQPIILYECAESA